MPNFDPPARKAELAFISWLQANQPTTPPLATLTWFPLAANNIKLYPRGIAECKSCTERPRFPGRGIYDASLSLWIVSDADLDTAEVHEARTGAVIALLNNRSPVKAFLNVPLTGPDTRTVQDFNVFDYTLQKFDNSRSGTNWIGEVELKLVCQGADAS
jgi:hypothetical protein